MDKRRGLGLVVALSLVAASLAPTTPAWARSPQTPQTEQDVSGCPVGIGLAITPGEHCVSWPVSQFPQMSGNAKACGEALFMLTPLNPKIDEYVALWYGWPGSKASPDAANPWLFTSDSGGPYAGEQTWSTTALTPQNTGVNVHYEVPAGSGAWFVGAGGGPGPCTPNIGIAAQGWAVTYKWKVSGQVTYAYTDKPAVGVTVTADCPSGGTTTTDDNGDYRFLLDKGPCTIVPTPPDGLDVDPDKQVLDVEGSIDNVNFQVYATLYYAVENGLSVKSNSSTGAGLIKAGTAFTEQVTLKDISKTKTVVVAPIYPTLSGNANGGALQPVGGVVQRQITSLSTANPSPIVVLAPGQEQVFDSVIYTDASKVLGTDNGGKKVSGGTRATVQFAMPNAFVLKAGNNLEPLDPRQIVVEKGSTDKITVSIDDSAPDQMPFNGYLAAEDISWGLVLGLYHFTVGLVQGVCTAIKALGSAVVNLPTAVINYVDAEAQLWQEVKDDPVESALFLNIVTNQMLLVYKQAPFLLKKLGDLKAAVDSAVYQHFNQIEQDWREGDWEAAVTAWADDGANLSANLLILNPELMAGAIGDATLARVPGVVEDLDAAEAAQFAKNDAVVDEALGTGSSEGEIAEAEAADEALAPGNILSPERMAQIFGVSPAEFASMVETAKKYDVLITLRSRASEAISLVEKGLSYVKPAAIKLKTVSAIDVKYLGYPADIALDGQEVSTIGQVLVKQPLFLSADCPAACALPKFQADILSLGVTRDSPEFYEIQSRWVQRYGEWISNDPGYVSNLETASKDHVLTLDWHWGENHIYPDMVQSAQKVGFRMAPGPAGALVPEVRLPGQAWKSVTGDIDLVSITNTDNSALSNEQYVEVLEEMGAGPVQIQHPATATWYSQVNDDTFLFDPNDPNFADKAKYMQADKCCLMQIGPDGKARAVQFQLDGSQFVDQNNYYINYVGGYRAPAPGVLGTAP
jgi:hypothetical protein